MKNCCNGHEWKAEMIRRWNDLVLMYQKIREHPTVSIVLTFLWELVKILFRIAVRKRLEELFDVS